MFLSESLDNVKAWMLICESLNNNLNKNFDNKLCQIIYNIMCEFMVFPFFRYFII